MMTTVKPPNDFTERLRRIEEKRSQSGRKPITEARRDLRFPRQKKPQPLRGTFIALVVIAGLAIAGYAALTSATGGRPAGQQTAD